MSLLAPADQERLREEFAAMTAPVRLLFFTKTLDGETCLQTRQILDELPPLSDKITISDVNVVLEPDTAARYAIDRAPAIAVLGRDEAGQERDSHIRFLGTPSGYEFISLVRAILLVGGGESQLSEGSRARVSAVDRPITMHVFTTPTCPHCPRAVTLAHEMAWANAHITAFAVEATEFPDLARQYQVSGVPKTVIADSLEETIEILGALPEDAFVEESLAAFRSDQDAGANVTKA